MARMVWLLMFVVGFALAFATRSPLLLGVGIVLGLVGTFGFVLALAAARVSANARPETSMASIEDLAALRKDRPAPASAAASNAKAEPMDRLP